MKTQKLTENAVKEVFAESKNATEVIVNTLKRIGVLNSSNDIKKANSYYDFETITEQVPNACAVDVNGYKFAYSTDDGLILYMNMNEYDLKKLP